MTGIAHFSIVLRRPRFDSAKWLWQGAPPNPPLTLQRGFSDWSLETMVKPEWVTKRTCPKCATRFYDLGKEDPVHFIECGTDFMPEPVLKSKQPMAFEVVAADKKTDDKELAAEDDLEINEDAEPSADEEVDLDTGDSDLGVETETGDDDN
jgi:uncharacterized protein (TIGR02300 family)